VIGNPYVDAIRTSEKIAEWKRQGLSKEKIVTLAQQDGLIGSNLAPVDVPGVINLVDNGAREDVLKFAAAIAFGKAVGGAKANVGSISHISGVNLPKSQSKMIADFEAAGYPTKPVVSPTSGNVVGTQYILPDGSRVRVMQADGRSPQRASFENANGGPVDPTTGKPPQPPQGLSKAERKQWIRERTHIEQVD